MQHRPMNAIAAAFLCSLLVSPLNATAQTGTGDLEAIKEKTLLCQGCHGAKGEGMNMPAGQASAPRLAGQIDAYFVKAMNDYKNDVRVDPMMNAIAKGLTESDITNLAAYYSSLK